MSTRANLTVWDREFYLSSDGYPEFVLEELMELRSGKREALFNCYENLEQGSGSIIDYAYDFTSENDDIVVTVSGNLEEYDWSRCPNWEVIERTPRSVKLKLRPVPTIEDRICQEREATDV